MKPIVKLLESNHWHVRWTPNLWFQWPAGRRPEISDGFGWVTEEHRGIAELLVEEEQTANEVKP